MPAPSSPGPLVPHTLWRVHDDPDVPALVYAVEPRRRRVALWVPPAAAAVAVLAWLLGAPALLASTAAAAAALGAVAWSVGGGTGYYELSRGGLGPFLGRRVPDLSGRVRERWQGGDVRMSS